MTTVGARPRPGLRLLSASMDDARCIALVAELQDGYRALYGSPDGEPMRAPDFAPPVGGFLLALDAYGQQVGCIGVRRHNEGTGEIKRMYVRPAFRRRGYAQALLVAAEKLARDLGYRAMVLETGTVQPEAVALYEAHGYRPIPGYGHYQGAELSRFFRREI